ncbi:MAG: hypothetical protein D5S01_11680, partial [Halanaerobium sp. MSAO_Bac5]
MRKIKFEEQNKKRKAAKIKLLEIRDELEKVRDESKLERDLEKQNLLFKLAREKQQRILEKIGERKYRFK